MSKRGLTMIELLLALVLLTSIVGATAAWTAVAARIGTGQRGPHRWLNAAEAVLKLIADDLATGDFVDDDPKQPPHVQVADGVLTIRTRATGREAGGAIIHRYSLDALTAQLEVTEDLPLQDTKARLLLPDVAGFQCVWHPIEHTVEVTIQSKALVEPAGGQPEATLDAVGLTRRLFVR